jgi:tetratricopeptide (TPR) repeat protein
MGRPIAGRLMAASLAALICAGTVPLPALAQSAAAAQADRATLAKGLQAQYEVALIRERKLADDRETEMISALEARLRQARATADAAKGDARQARAELATARADYARLAAQVAARDAGAQSGIAGYQAQAEHIAADASPAMAAALQRFADGDRVGAWPKIVALATTESAAPGVTTVQRAASARQLAELRDIMRAHGEATTADVLGLFDAAADLAPTNFRLQIQRSRPAADLGDLPRAKAAAERAVAVAVNDGERSTALRAVGEQAASQGDNAAAAKDFDQALAMLIRTTGGDPVAKSQNDVASVLQDKGDLQVSMTEFDGARISYNEALVIRQRLAAADPGDVGMQNYVTSVLQRIGDLDLKLGDAKAAQSAFEQALAIRQRLAVGDPGNTDLQYYVSALLRRVGDLALQQGDYKAARQDYEQCLAIRERLSAANPASAHLRNAMALDYFDLGEVQSAQNDEAGARASYEKSLEMRRKLAAADPTNAATQQLILRVMTRLAKMGGSSITWRDVADQYAAIKKAGHLTPGDEKVLDALRAHRLAGGL